MACDNIHVFKGLWGLLAIQAICAGLLMIWIGIEFYQEIKMDGSEKQTELRSAFQTHSFQLTVVGFLAVSLISTVLIINRLKGSNEHKDELLRAATGDYFDLVQQYFDDWGLTPSERDVAVLSIKGLMISEIAQLRNTKIGTIKAQCASIYRKAGISGRPQLLSLFLDELIAMGLSDYQGKRPETIKTETEMPN